jgi:catechol 2,3-dioxygenase-like lactoylglutathione lyase family enzyme
MTMKARLLGVLTLAALAALAEPVYAQAKPNPQGVVFHNISFQVPDYDANVDFFTKLGLIKQPSESTNRFSVFRCPNSDVSYTVQEDLKASGGSVGTVLDHIGFQVPDVPTAVAKWKGLGLRVEPGNAANSPVRAQQAYVYSPDNVKMEILQDPMMTTNIKPHHVHFFTSDPIATQAFYANVFGAVPGKRAIFDAADVPNMNLTFSKANGPVVSTDGHPLHHIGFGVPNVEQAMKEMEAKGVVFDPALQPPPRPGPLHIAFFVDPWGTLVELFRTDPIPPAAAPGQQ